MKCSYCGAHLTDDSKYCSYCGQKTEIDNSFVSENDSSTCHEETEQAKCIESNNGKSFYDKVTHKCAEYWNSLSLYGKTVSVSLVVFMFIGLIALIIGKTVAVIIAAIQIIIAVISILMHNNIIRLEDNRKWLKWLALVVSALLLILYIASYSWGKELEPEATIPSPTPTNQSIETPNAAQEQAEALDMNTTFSIAKGTEYAYMTDEWDVYIATAVSDEIIKITNWSKTFSTAKTLEHDYEVGAFKINDAKNCFSWVDDEHTAFVISFVDKNNKKFQNGGVATFTININDRDVNKGTNYSKDIACYSYQNDDWHLYRAIPLTENLIKIETWYRGVSTNNFLFGYDLALINISDESTDFEWTDEEHTSFSITMKDENNKYEWEEENFVVFVLENEKYKHFDVKSYLGKWEITEDEAVISASSSDYKYQNYLDVQTSLKNAGFSNISTEILYDIVWGLTEEGEVKSVSVNGSTDFEKGDIFKRDIPIVITYHLKEAKDPANIIVSKSADTYTGNNYLDVKEEFESLGFTNIDISEVSTTDSSHTAGEVVSIKISGFSFSPGDYFKPTDNVCIKYYTLAETQAVYYSTNDIETAKNGNSGVYSYKSSGGVYDIYWIVDFDEGFVYWFTDGNGDINCDKLQIESGTLNDVLKITYHDTDSSWSYGLYFKWKNQPEHLILQDDDGFTYDFYPTDLNNALNIKATKNIIEY